MSVSIHEEVDQIIKVVDKKQEQDKAKDINIESAGAAEELIRRIIMVKNYIQYLKKLENLFINYQ